MESSSVNLIGTPEGLLIDLTDEETVPFPQQLITAEIDDTFGLFSSASSKSRCHSAPVTGGSMGHDVFSPIFLARACETTEDDSVFKDPNLLSDTPTVIKSGRKHKRYETVKIGSEQILAAADISRLGLNDGFVGGEGDTILSTEISVISTASASDMNRLNVSGDTTYVSPIAFTNNDSDTSSNAGITSTVMDESKLFDLEDFNICNGSVFKPFTTQQTIDAKVDDVIAKVFERRKSSIRKPVDDEISRKVQEMFDAASPTKNPHLYTSGYAQSRRSYTPARAVVSHEPFSYGTPRRHPVLIPDTEVNVLDATVTPIVSVGPQLSNIVETGKTERCIVPTDCGSRDIIPGNSAGPATPSALREFNHNHFKTPTRLVFSSSSSSDGDSVNSNKLTLGDSQVKIPAIKPIGYSLPRLRQAQPIKATAQPMKAVHPTVKLSKPEEGTKTAKFYGTASAPVHRKFVPPIASSSPIVTPPRNKPRTIIKSSGYGQIRALPLPSGVHHGVGTSQSRIPPPSPKQHVPVPGPDTHQSTGPAIKRRSFSVGDHGKPTGSASSIPPRRQVPKENVPRFGKK